MMELILELVLYLRSVSFSGISISWNSFFASLVFITTFSIGKSSSTSSCILFSTFSINSSLFIFNGIVAFDDNVEYAKGLLEKAEAAGTKYMLVEQDNCNGEDPLDCLRRSYQYLRAMGFQ